MRHLMVNKPAEVNHAYPVGYIGWRAWVPVTFVVEYVRLAAVRFHDGSTESRTARDVTPIQNGKMNLCSRYKSLKFIKNTPKIIGTPNPTILLATPLACISPLIVPFMTQNSPSMAYFVYRMIVSD